jgi:hypothetical protein
MLKKGVFGKLTDVMISIKLFLSSIAIYISYPSINRHYKFQIYFLRNDKKFLMLELKIFVVQNCETVLQKLSESKL